MIPRRQCGLSGGTARRLRGATTLAAVAPVLALLATHAVLAGVRSDFEPIDTDNWRRIGFLSFKPKVLVKDIGIDSNIFLTTEDPVSDFTATIAPSALGEIRFANRGFLTLDAGAEYVWYKDHPSVTHTNYALGAKGNLNFRSLKFFAGSSYQNIQERPNNEIDRRTERINERVRGGVGYEISPRLAVDYILSRERITYQDSDFLYSFNCQPASGGEDPAGSECSYYTLNDLLGRIETIGTLRLSRRVLGRTRLLLDWEDRRYEFQAGLPQADASGTLPVVGSMKNATEQRILGGFELEPGASLSGLLRIGVTDFRPEYLTAQQTNQWLGAAEFNWRLGGQVAMHTVVDRDLYFSIYGDNLYYEQSHAGVGFVIYLNRYLGIDAGYDAYRLVWPQLEGSDANGSVNRVQERKQDNIHKIGGGVRFRLANNSAITVRLVEYQRTSTLPNVDKHQLMLTTGIEATF